MMKTPYYSLFVGLLLLLSCKQESPETTPAPDFSFTVEAVDAIRTFGQESSVYPEVVVTITDGNQGDYTLEFWLDGDKGAVQKMTKLWPGVPRHIPVFGKKDWGGTRVTGRIYRSDRFGATKDFETEVFVRSGDINDVGGTMLGVKTKNASMNYSIMPDEVVTVYRWDEFDVKFAPAPCNGIYLTSAESDDPSVLEVLSCTDTIKSNGTTPANAIARVFLKDAGRVNLAFSVFNGGQKTTVVQPFEVVEDLSVIDKAVILSSAYLQCSGSTNSWRAYYPAEFVAEFSSANPEVQHDYSLSIDGVVVYKASNATILDRKVGIPLDWEAVAATEGLVLSEGEHNFTFSVARCDGMDLDALTGKFVVEDTGLGIQKAEFKYQDTTGEWQMYRPGVVMVDFSLVNMESLHRVIFSIDGTKVYEKEHVRFSEGVASGETATTYQLSLDWDATAALVDLQEGEHTFKLLVEREDGHSKAAYDGKFTVTGGFPGPEITTFECGSSIWRYEDLQVYIELNVPFTDETAVITLRIDGDEFYSCSESCEAGTIIINKVFSTRNNATLREATEDEGKHELTIWTHYENHPEVSSIKNIKFDVVFPYMELDLPSTQTLDVFDDHIENDYLNCEVSCVGTYQTYKCSIFFEGRHIEDFSIFGNEHMSCTFNLPQYVLREMPDEYDATLSAVLYDARGDYLRQQDFTIHFTKRYID